MGAPASAGAPSRSGDHEHEVVMKLMTQREAFLAAHRKQLEAIAPKAKSYGTRLREAREAMSAAPAACVVPTKAGYDCEGKVIDGEQFCGPHKRTVGKAVGAVLLVTLR